MVPELVPRSPCADDAKYKKYGTAQTILIHKASYGYGNGRKCSNSRESPPRI